MTSNGIYFPWLDGVSTLEHEDNLDATVVDSYIRNNSELLDALELSKGESFIVQHIGNGEHNEVFAVLDENKKAICAIRINRKNLCENSTAQTIYTLKTLDALGKFEYKPGVKYQDLSKSKLPYDISVVEFCHGRQLDYANPKDLELAANFFAELHCVKIADQNDKFSHLDHLKDTIPNLIEDSMTWYNRYASSPYAENHIINYIKKFINKTLEAKQPPTPAQLDNRLVLQEVGASQFIVDDDKIWCVDWDFPGVGSIERDVVDFIVPTTTLWDSEYVFTRDGAKAWFNTYWEAVDNRFSDNGFWERLDSCIKACALRGITWYLDAVVNYNDPDFTFKTSITKKRIKVALSDEHLQLLDKLIFSAR